MQITISLPPELLEAIQKNTAAVEKFIEKLELEAVLPKELPAKPKKVATPKKEVETPAEPVKEEPAPVKEDVPVKEESPVQAISLEVVRKKLADLSAQGKAQQLQVKAALTELGFKKLSDVPVEKYAELLAAAGASE